MRRLLVTALPAVALVIAAAPAEAADGFVEAGVGALYGRLAQFRYDDPVGSLFAANATDGSLIKPESLRRNPWASATNLSLGYRFGTRYFLRATYRYFGPQEAVADGIFFRNPIDPSRLSPPFPQRLTATAHGFFLGAGVEWEASPTWFVDAALEAGASLVRVAGVRDVNTVIEEAFPAAARVNPAYGAGLTVGRRLGRDLALVLTLNWNHLGAADTGRAPDIGGGPRFVPASVRPNASLTAQVSAASLTFGLRCGF